MHAARSSAGRTAVLPVTPAVAAEEHFRDVPNDAPAQQQNVGGPEGKPSVAAQENLPQGNGAANEFNAISKTERREISSKIARSAYVLPPAPRRKSSLRIGEENFGRRRRRYSIEVRLKKIQPKKITFSNRRNQDRIKLPLTTARR